MSEHRGYRSGSSITLELEVTHDGYPDEVAWHMLAALEGLARRSGGRIKIMAWSHRCEPSPGSRDLPVSEESLRTPVL